MMAPGRWVLEGGAAGDAPDGAFEARDGDFKVEIYTNDERENEMLDEIGYADVGLHPSPR